MEDDGVIKFTVVGVIPSFEYQKSKFLVEQLYRYFPEKYRSPELRPMLDVAWNEYRWKIRRRLGGHTWVSKKDVAVFMNDYYVGDDHDLRKLIETKYHINIFKNFRKLGVENLKRHLDNTNRPYVYFKIYIKRELAGVLLFELYIDLVPIVCNNFLRLVQRKRRGYKGCVINRICATSWIEINGNLKSAAIPCENYYVPHDRRGVISMCHSGKHKNNSTAFFISLNQTPWMDYYYVAFGQLIHGESVLQKIENVPTLHESPLVPITVEDCGDYVISNDPDAYIMKKYKQYLERNIRVQKQLEEEFLLDIQQQDEILRKVELDILKSLEGMVGEQYELEREEQRDRKRRIEEEIEELHTRVFTLPIHMPDVIDPRDKDSEFNLKRLKRGLYSL